MTSTIILCEFNHILILTRSIAKYHWGVFMTTRHQLKPQWIISQMIVLFELWIPVTTKLIFQLINFSFYNDVAYICQNRSTNFFGVCNSQVMFLKWGGGKVILIGTTGPLQSECPQSPQAILGGSGGMPLWEIFQKRNPNVAF